MPLVKVKDAHVERFEASSPLGYDDAINGVGNLGDKVDDYRVANPDKGLLSMSSVSTWKTKLNGITHYVATCTGTYTKDDIA